jgi:hypothetical protein
MQLMVQLAHGEAHDFDVIQLASPALPGRSLAARLPVFGSSGCPLAYLWPPGPRPDPYLGAAHGLMGILYVLLHCRQVIAAAAAADNGGGGGGALQASWLALLMIHRF